MITKNDIEKLLAYNGLIFSLEEKIVGKWIDGKPLYQKTINFGSLPNNTTKNVAHGISNMGTVVSCYGMLKETNSFASLPLNTAGSVSDTWEVSLAVNETNIVIITGANRTGTSVYVTLQYTKTTD